MNYDFSFGSDAPGGWKNVDSTCLAAVKWEPGDVLTLRFRKGSVYQYVGVPEQVYRDLLRSSSKGRYYVYMIRGQYQGAYL